jgi:hypothetical protein
LYPAVYYNYAVLLSTLRRHDNLKVLLDKAITIPGITLSTIDNEYAILFEQQSNLDLAIEHSKKMGDEHLG